MSNRVTVNRSEGVADVRLSRAEKLNALDTAMFEALVETGKSLAAEPWLRAVVLSGEGRAFSAGLDFASFLAMSSERPARDFFERSEATPANYAQRAAWIWNELPVPVIAAVHGVAYGGGLQIALAADIRIVHPDAQLSVMEIKWGLVPDMTGTQTLRHLVRLDVAKELTFTGRIVSGAEAVEIGLATRVSPNPYEEALALARDIAGKSPHAIRAAKRLLNETVIGGRADALRLEESLQRSLIGSPNQLEAVQANMEKRAPSFSDPE